MFHSPDQRKSFADLAELCESILKAERKDKKDILINYIHQWKKDETYNPSQAETSFFPCLRLLCPSLDRSRSPFGLKEFALGREYLKILGINKESKEGQMLTNYKLPRFAKVDGDLSSIIKRVMSKRSRVDKSNLTIKQINDCLDQIALANKDNDQARVDSTMEYLIKNLGPLENKWLIRIILKYLNFGLSDTVILNTFHPDARSFYDSNQDLAEICVKLADDRVRGFEIKLSLFKPFGPMLAQRIELKQIESLISAKSFCMEKKYDGERITLHKNGGCFKFFSRNGFDYSNTFNQSFTPFIGDCFNRISDCILDGEMMGFNEANGCLITKSQLDFDVKKIDSSDVDHFHGIYFVFDVLHLNGESLISKPFKERIKLQEEYLKPKENWLLIAERREGKSKADAIRWLNEAIEKRDEGIIIKAWDSIYKPNIRKRSDWFKLKPEYIEGLMDDLDLLIVGGYYGEGRRGGIISQFLLAVAVKDDEHIDGRKFRSFGRVGSGYSDQQLLELLHKLEPHWVKYEPSNPPDFLELAKVKPELYIEPENSHIVQIKASEFMESDDFATGVTLRFPRVVRIRYDKSWSDCLTTDELDQLKEQGNLVTRQIGLDSDQEEPIKRRRKPVDERTLASHFALPNLDSVEMQRNLFQGKEICVLNGSKEVLEKGQIEKLIIQFGGKITALPTRETFCLIAYSTQDLRVKNFIKSGNYDILHLKWFLNIVQRKQFVSPKYYDYIAMREQTKQGLRKFYDQYGDSYFCDTTAKEISTLLESLDEKFGPIDSIEDDNDLDTLLSQNDVSYLHRLKVYVSPNKDDYASEMVKFSLIFGGAKILDNIDGATHELVPSKSNNDELILESLGAEPNFIFDSNQQKWLIEEEM